MSNPNEKDKRPEDDSLELEPEAVKDLDVDEGRADTVGGGNSAGATRPGPTH
jgi:hypothetical protein